MSKSKWWILGFVICVVILMGGVAYCTIKVDPYFHYHKPHTDWYFYTIDNQRSQNDGISRHFEYEAIITGTSMTENFKVTDAKKIFGCEFIKVPYSGGTYYEINNNVKVAIAHQPKLKMVIRGLDISHLIEDKCATREDLGKYPYYLYDDNPFNDVKYLFNRNIVFSRVTSMLKERNETGFKPGITSFDDYSNWMKWYSFGKNAVCTQDCSQMAAAEQEPLTDSEIRMVQDNVHQNVISVADDHPDIVFYYFFPPYSGVWWQQKYNDGQLNKHIQAERIAVEEILKTPNIKLFSFNNMDDIVNDLNNYKDSMHYGEWINSLMLRYMKDEVGLLTTSNYEDYLDFEKEKWSLRDYLKEYEDQTDYECDYYAAALLNKKINGVVPYHLGDADLMNCALSNAEVVKDQFNGCAGIQCGCSFKQKSIIDSSLGDDSPDEKYTGFTLDIPKIEKYRYLVFYCRQVDAQGSPNIKVDNTEGTVVVHVITADLKDQSEWRQYLVDLSKIDETESIRFDCGYTEDLSGEEMIYIFSDISFY